MSRAGRWVVAAIAIGLVAVAVVRTTQTGFSSIDADDPHYLYQGHSALELRMPEQVDGSFPNLRAPLYGVVIAAGDAVVGGDAFLGAHLVAFVLALATLAAAVAVGARLGGAPAAAGVALALLVTPLIWRMLPSLRIDLVHAGAVLGVVLAAWRPSTRRWALAGVAFGLTLLMKESVALLALLPCAWLGLLPTRQVLRLAGAYVGAAALTAGWWWVLVWIQVREVFPAGNVRETIERDVGRPFMFNTYAWLLVAALAVGWLLFVVAWHRRGDARLVMVAGAATALPAAIAWQQELDLRQFTPLAVVSCVAAGTAYARLATAAWRGRHERTPAAAAAGLAVVVAATFTTTSQVRTPALQHTVGVASELSRWMAPRLDEHTRVVMTHRDHGELALRLHGDVYVERIEFEPADTPDLDEFIWLGTNRGRLLGVTRAEVADRLREPDTGFLVLTGPHLLSLRGVDQVLRTNEATPAGITPAAGIAADGFHAHVFAVEPLAVDARLSDLPLTMTARAAQTWLDQRAGTVGEARARGELLAAAPRVVGNPDALRALGTRLGPEGVAALGLPRSPFVSRR